MKIAAILHTVVYRGDRDADVTVAVELLPGETVHNLAERLLATAWSVEQTVDGIARGSHGIDPSPYDWIEVRALIDTPRPRK